MHYKRHEIPTEAFYGLDPGLILLNRDEMSADAFLRGNRGAKITNRHDEMHFTLNGRRIVNCATSPIDEFFDGSIKIDPLPGESQDNLAEQAAGQGEP